MIRSEMLNKSMLFQMFNLFQKIQKAALKKQAIHVVCFFTEIRNG